MFATQVEAQHLLDRIFFQNASKNLRVLAFFFSSLQCLLFLFGINEQRGRRECYLPLSAEVRCPHGTNTQSDVIQMRSNNIALKKSR